MGASKLVVLAAFALGGCDLVFGIDAEEEPCTLAEFTQESGVDLVEAEAFAFDWEETFGVVQAPDGLPYEIDRNGAVSRGIDLGSYLSISLALAPEGDALFYTVVTEPMLLKGALRGDPYALHAGVPRGTFAGAPSADVFGPRRVMVKLRFGLEDMSVQEYEDTGAAWVTVGEPQPIATERAPNLTPDGLTMVWSGFTEAGEPAVFAAQRGSRSATFGEAVKILDGAFTQVQLCGRCTRLYATDGTMLRRYE